MLSELVGTVTGGVVAVSSDSNGVTLATVGVAALFVGAASAVSLLWVAVRGLLVLFQNIFQALKAWPMIVWLFMGAFFVRDVAFAVRGSIGAFDLFVGSFRDPSVYIFSCFLWICRKIFMIGVAVEYLFNFQSIRIFNLVGLVHSDDICCKFWICCRVSRVFR